MQSPLAHILFLLLLLIFHLNHLNLSHAQSISDIPRLIFRAIPTTNSSSPSPHPSLTNSAAPSPLVYIRPDVGAAISLVEEILLSVPSLNSKVSLVISKTYKPPPRSRSTLIESNNAGFPLISFFFSSKLSFRQPILSSIQFNLYRDPTPLYFDRSPCLSASLYLQDTAQPGTLRLLKINQKSRHCPSESQLLETAVEVAKQIGAISVEFSDAAFTSVFSDYSDHELADTCEAKPVLVKALFAEERPTESNLATLLSRFTNATTPSSPHLLQFQFQMQRTSPQEWNTAILEAAQYIHSVTVCEVKEQLVKMIGRHHNTPVKPRLEDFPSPFNNRLRSDSLSRMLKEQCQSNNILENVDCVSVINLLLGRQQNFRFLPFAAAAARHSISKSVQVLTQNFVMEMFISAD